MNIILANPVRLILSEIENKSLKQKDVAQTYRLILNQGTPVDWSKINQAIVDRWSLSGLHRIKEMAISGKCFK